MTHIFRLASLSSPDVAALARAAGNVRPVSLLLYLHRLLLYLACASHASAPMLFSGFHPRSNAIRRTR
ncbi:MULTISPECIES: hypothetical protein [unclassified Variovorax]|jgi:hypothetical protein|uniref:hypothetical protein n=1 Tax=unclassified Variovorax TaxID=663243 RepID=UPI0008D77E90|nr:MULTISPECIES: hypothetical protein [unclassified Variovorax]SEK08207.1 hypothetical protein SAMN05518853_10878 [Variovorax sp. OK202]SFD54902.1 hypothetical protein SAMN05444746_10878 [Variovorax sp. OK212]